MSIMESLNHFQGKLKTSSLFERLFMYFLSTAAYFESLNLSVANGDHPASNCISQQQSHVNCRMDCRLKINCLYSFPKESIVWPNSWKTDLDCYCFHCCCAIITIDSKIQNSTTTTLSLVICITIFHYYMCQKEHTYKLTEQCQWMYIPIPIIIILIVVSWWIKNINIWWRFHDIAWVIGTD